MKFTGLFYPWQTYILNEAVNTASDCHAHGLASVVFGPVHYLRIFHADGDLLAPPVFVPPVAAAGPRPEPPIGANALQLSNHKALADAWDRTAAEYRSYVKAHNGLKAIIIATLAEVDLRNPIINNPEFGFTNTSMAAIYSYMHSKYGVATPQQVRANILAMSEKWNPANSSLEEHIVRLSVRISTAALQHNNPLSEIAKVTLLRDSLSNAPYWVKVAIDLYERSIVSPAMPMFDGLNNDGLAPRLVAEAARVTDDMAGAKGFAGATSRESDDGSANAATHDRAVNAEVLQLKRDNAQLKTRLASLEKPKGARNPPRKCSSCGVSFVPPLPRHVDCKTCHDAFHEARRQGQGQEQGQTKP
jgi:hypothetical protein